MQEGLGVNTLHTFLNVKKGKFVLRKENEEKVFDSITGYLINLFVRKDGRFGDELHLSIKVKEEVYVIQTLLKSGYAKSFLSAFPNMDCKELLQLIPRANEDEDGNIRTSMIFRQNDGAVKWYYTKDTPHGMPAGVACKIKNAKNELVDGFDYTDRNNFFKRIIAEKYLPRIQEASGTKEAVTPNAPDIQGDDDLPF